jgi:hypothetical protein
LNSLTAADALSASSAVAPRVALSDIESAIAEKHFIRADHAIGAPGANPALGLLTICIVVMRNGFVIVGKSAPASPENFNPELGRTFAYEDAVRQAWPLMGFALREKLSGR